MNYPGEIQEHILARKASAYERFSHYGQTVKKLGARQQILQLRLPLRPQIHQSQTLASAGGSLQQTLGTGVGQCAQIQGWATWESA